MKKGILVVLGILVPVLFAINILRSFYLEDGTYVGLTYILQRFDDYDFNSTDYIYEIAQVGSSWEAVGFPDLSLGDQIEAVFVALFNTIALPVRIFFLICQDLLTVISFIIDVLGFYPGAQESAVGG